MHHVSIPANYRLHALPRQEDNIKMVYEWGAEQNIDYLRVHNVDISTHALRVACAFTLKNPNRQQFDVHS